MWSDQPCLISAGFAVYDASQHNCAGRKCALGHADGGSRLDTRGLVPIGELNTEDHLICPGRLTQRRAARPLPSEENGSWLRLAEGASGSSLSYELLDAYR